MDTFTAVPRIRRFVVTVVDQEKLPAFYESTDINEPIPTKTQILIGYEKGPGCPATIVMEVDGIETEYETLLPNREELGTEETPGTLTTNEYYDKLRRANMLLRRNLLLAVIRGLDLESANVLANEDAQGNTMLIQLGWIPDRSVPAEKEEENKEEGEGVTGESS